jgi:hypothetical protein
MIGIIVFEVRHIKRSSGFADDRDDEDEDRNGDEAEDQHKPAMATNELMPHLKLYERRRRVVNQVQTTTTGAQIFLMEIAAIDNEFAKADTQLRNGLMLLQKSRKDPEIGGLDVYEYPRSRDVSREKNHRSSIAESDELIAEWIRWLHYYAEGSKRATGILLHDTVAFYLEML